ncbi:unnamed protein product [Auanema sp. JU1783]|nr:unnamed protein product [Auanema sp. JU1783]
METVTALDVPAMEQPPAKRAKDITQDLLTNTTETLDTLSSNASTSHESNGLELLQIFNSMVAGASSIANLKNSPKPISTKKKPSIQIQMEKQQLNSLKEAAKKKAFLKKEEIRTSEEDCEKPTKIAPIYTHPLLSPEQAVNSLYHLNRAQIIQFSLHAIDAISGVIEEKMERQKYLDKRRLDLAHILIRLGLAHGSESEVIPDS